jgi:ACS family sodium-dependent inorganic phosphate cotransporter
MKKDYEAHELAGLSSATPANPVRPRRHWVVWLCFFAVFICYIDRVNISVAALVMQERFGWSEAMKGFILSSFFIGYVLFQIPAGYIVNRLGGRAVLLAAVLWWSACTFLTPFAASTIGSLVVVRIAMGIGESATFPAAYNLFAQHVTAEERSRAISILLSGIPVGTLFALGISGYAVVRWGWQSVFYLFGSAGALWSLLWCSKVPPRVTSHRRGSKPISLSVLLSKPAVWALIVNHFCSNWLLYVLIAWLPSYFRQVQHLPIAAAGLAAAIPWLTMLVMTNVGAWFADASIRRGASVLIVRKSMQATGLIGSAVALLLTRHATNATSAQILICLALSALALTWSGFTPNHLEIAPQHADILMAVTNTAGTLPGVIGIAVTGWLIQTTGSYDSAFLLAAGINIVGAGVWVLFARASPIFD